MAEIVRCSFMQQTDRWDWNYTVRHLFRQGSAEYDNCDAFFTGHVLYKKCGVNISLIQSASNQIKIISFCMLL